MEYGEGRLVGRKRLLLQAKTRDAWSAPLLTSCGRLLFFCRLRSPIDCSSSLQIVWALQASWANMRAISFLEGRWSSFSSGSMKSLQNGKSSNIFQCSGCMTSQGRLYLCQTQWLLEYILLYLEDEAGGQRRKQCGRAWDHCSLCMGSNLPCRMCSICIGDLLAVCQIFPMGDKPADWVQSFFP